MVRMRAQRGCPSWHQARTPADLEAALADDAQARSFFEGLSYSNKRRVVLPIGDAKTEETRQRRIAKSGAKLREGEV